jgi:hypothetical protein
MATRNRPKGHIHLRLLSDFLLQLVSWSDANVMESAAIDIYLQMHCTSLSF